MFLSKSVSNYIDHMDEVMKLLPKVMNVDSMANMTEDEFKLFQAIIKLVNASNDVLLEQSHLLRRIDEKIDKLLSEQKEERA